jgi:hypothetical protein
LRKVGFAFEWENASNAGVVVSNKYNILIRLLRVPANRIANWGRHGSAAPVSRPIFPAKLSLQNRPYPARC